mmetsp:Transcript_59622/g.146443  ORF Transcript_59622/g.146443 Transcript_59622/m.146443 type:complete len:410 (+) Transcript_59622:13-1242(+)
MAWLFGGEEGIHDPQQAQAAIAQLIQERDALQNKVKDLEGSITEQKVQIGNLEKQAEEAQEKAQKVINVARTKMGRVNRREVEILSLSKRLAVVSSVYGLQTDIGNLSRNLAKAREAVFPSPLIISGPGGVGKATLISKLFQDYEDYFGFPTSYTSREMAQGEQQGVDFNFVKRGDMERAMKEGKFLEISEVEGDLYGTTIESVLRIRDEGRICVLRIDLDGVEQIKSSSVALNPVCVWITPPSVAVLRERLLARGVPDDGELEERVQQAEQEITRVSEKGRQLFDFSITNDTQDQAYAALKRVLMQFPSMESILKDAGGAHTHQPQKHVAPAQAPARGPPSNTPTPIKPSEDDQVQTALRINESMRHDTAALQGKPALKESDVNGVDQDDDDDEEDDEDEDEDEDETL